ncbi:MAG: DUF3047 domain-containing protein [Candidatus Omnitrophota bacterium]
MIRRTSFVMAFLTLVFGLWFFNASKIAAKEDTSKMRFFEFDEESALKEWTEKIFKGRVYYNVERSKQDSFVHALSQDAASGFYYRVRINALKYPMVSWKWKVARFPQVAEKDGAQLAGNLDDFAARVYLIFPSGSFRTSRCIEYVWDEHLPQGTITDSAWGKNVKIIVVRSGLDKDRWYKEERNVYEDFKTAFGYNTKLNIGAVAFMTDTDNTGGTAEAYYDDIKIGYSK